jgi:hypothetical protein
MTKEVIIMWILLHEKSNLIKKEHSVQIQCYNETDLLDCLIHVDFRSIVCICGSFRD